MPDLYERNEQTVLRVAYRYCHDNPLQTGSLPNLSGDIVRA